MNELSDSSSGSEDETPSTDAGARVQKKHKQADRIDLEALQEHGYKSGPSVLYVPAPKQAEQSWEWGSGKETSAAARDDEETAEEREQTQAAANAGAEEAAAVSRKAMQLHANMRADAAAEHRQMAQDRRLTYQQKEKRKRDMGQAKKSKNYVEEEKRVARNYGMYSGFDT